MIFRVKKGHVGADLGAFQQAHVAKTQVFTIDFVDFRGVAIAPQKWAKWSRRWVKLGQDSPVRVQIVQIITHPFAQMIEKRLLMSNLQHKLKFIYQTRADNYKN